MEKWNIVILDGARTNPGDLSWEPLEAFGRLTVYPNSAPEEIVSSIGDHQIVVLDKPVITRQILEACPNLRLITLFATGFNNIDLEAAKEAMGAELLVYSRRRRPELEDAHTRYVSLDELYARSDIISLHCPVNADSEGMIDAAALRKMKDGAILLNTSRGALIVEEDVAEALRTGKLRALGQDAFAVEPIRPDNPLLTTPNTFLTPHVGWAPHETRARLLNIVADNIRCFLEGHPQNVVNP